MPNDAEKLTPAASPSAATSRSSKPASRPAPALAPRRDDSLDIAKGIGILLVVIGHVFDGLVASSYFPASLQWPSLVILVIYLFHMPLFFVISGHLASGKFRPAGVTIARMLPTIVYPYFLWSTVQSLVMIYLSKFTTSHIPVSSLYRILWNPVIPFWFLYALFLCHLGYLVIRKWPHWAQLTIAAIAFLAPQFFLSFFGSHQLTIVPETTRSFLYFILGVTTVPLVKQLGRWTAIASTVLFALLTYVYNQAQFVGAAAWPAAVPACICGILATLAWSRMLASRSAVNHGRPGRIARTLAFWGRYSMSIYVLHIFFTAGLRIALKRFASHPTPLATVLEIAVPTVLGIALPLAINWVVSKFDLDKWLGLQHMETT